MKGIGKLKKGKGVFELCFENLISQCSKNSIRKAYPLVFCNASSFLRNSRNRLRKKQGVNGVLCF